MIHAASLLLPVAFATPRRRSCPEHTEDPFARPHPTSSTGFQGHVDAEITEQAERTSTDDKAKVGAVASQLRDSAIDETAQSERTVGHARSTARASQFLDYAFYVVYSLLGIRLVLSLIAANASNGFVKFIRAVTGPFFAPFDGIVASPASEGGNTLVAPILIALLVYSILHAGINGLLRMVGHRKTTI